MRRPDSVSNGGAGNCDPDQARPCLRRDSTMKDIEGNNARNETNQSREQDKAPIVFTGKTGKNSEHEIARR
jgi:hypothetical protein